MSFKRFLDIAKLLRIETSVVTDNDGDYEKNIEKKYENYNEPFINICSGKDNNLNTLEPQFLFEGDNFTRLKNVLNKNDMTKEELKSFMENNKTEWALKVFLDEVEEFQFPEYILDAVR